MYGVLHDVNHKRTQDGALEPADRELSLQLPENLDRRVAELAARGASTPGETVEHVVAYLRENYEYSLDVGETDRQDPLGDFLFENRRGWCEYFAGCGVYFAPDPGRSDTVCRGVQRVGRDGVTALVARQWWRPMGCSSIGRIDGRGEPR